MLSNFNIIRIKVLPHFWYGTRNVAPYHVSGDWYILSTGAYIQIIEFIQHGYICEVQADGAAVPSKSIDRTRRAPSGAACCMLAAFCRVGSCMHAHATGDAPFR